MSDGRRLNWQLTSYTKFSASGDPVASTELRQDELVCSVVGTIEQIFEMASGSQTNDNSKSNQPSVARVDSD